MPQQDGRTWKLKETFSYVTDGGLAIKVPTGFVTDLASIPRVLWPVLPPFGKYSWAAIIHDWLYSEHRLGKAHYSRAYADAILLEAMRDCNVSRPVQWVVWMGVRIGAWTAWNKRMI
jgi:hypothetical protein